VPFTKSSIKYIAFYDFVYFVSVVSRQFISFVTKIEIVARITSSRLVITSSPRIWDRIDLVNTSSRSQWNAVSEAWEKYAQLLRRKRDRSSKQKLIYILSFRTRTQAFTRELLRVTKCFNW